MADTTKKDSQNPTDQGASGEGSKPDYLLDKFNSTEDQAKAYRDLEKKYHEDLNSVKAEIASLKKGVRVEDTQPHVVDDDSTELVEFYKSPSAYRQRVKDEVKQEIRREVAVVETLKQTLANFFNKNADLVGQEPLLEWYVRQEDPQLDPGEKLERAAKRTRDHITNLRKAPEPKPNPQDFVDEPSGAQPRTRPQSTSTPEDLRKDFFRSREGSRKHKAKGLPAGE